MGQDKELQEAFKEMFAKDVQTFIAVVTAVDKDKETVTVEDTDGFDFDNVRLSSVINDSDNKIIQYPKEQTTVLVSRIGDDDNTLFISAFSYVEEIEAKIGETEYLINADGYKIDRDGENLYTVLDDLIKNVDEQNEQVQAVAQELMKVVVSIGVTPNVPVITQIVTELVQIITDRTAINGRLNTILK